MNNRIDDITKEDDKEKELDISFKFDWSQLTEEVYNDVIEEPEESIDDCFGFIHVGELIFDVLIRDYDKGIAISYDCYVANEDTGYGYIEDDNGNITMAYDYADGTDIYELNLSYKEFVKTTEQLLTDFIKRENKTNSYSLIEKATAPLLFW